MKYKNFLLRAVNLLLILGVLWQYQQVALVRAAAVSQRKQEIAEVEAYNASVLQAQSAAQAEQSQSGYRDGIYEGSAYGFGDVIRVSVTIQNGKMTGIAVLTIIPFTPFGTALGFVALPAAYFAYLIPCILLYMVLATSLKKAYVRHYGELL